MLSFVHTSDWHLGHVYRKLGPRAGEAAQWRFEAARRVFDLATEHKADFVLVAGDVFDTNTPSREVMQAAIEVLRDAPVPTYLISGNHDPLAEGSVWRNPFFTDALAGVPHVHVAHTSAPLQVNDGDCILYPCPVVARHSRADATVCIPDGPRSASQARIGLAHGGWQGYWNNGETASFNSIASNTAERCGLDYLALGDYHSFTPPEHRAAKARTYYSGTPEISAHDDARAGHALLVQLEKSGSNPIVTPYPTGRAQCSNWGAIQLKPGDGINVLEAKLEAIEDRQGTLIRARIEGCVSHNEWRELHEWLGTLHEQVLGADLDTSRLLTEPTRDDFRALQLAAPEQHLLEVLESPLDASRLSGITDGEVIAQWSHDEAARRAARSLYFQLLRGE